MKAKKNRRESKMELSDKYVFRKTIWNSSLCPEEELIGEIYPGQIVSFYIYLCLEDLSSRLVLPTYVSVLKLSGGSYKSQLIYHETYFGNNSYFYNKDLYKNSSVAWEAYVTTNVSLPSRFGVWPDERSGISNYRLTVNFEKSIHDPLILTQDFTFLTPKLYVKLPPSADCLSQYTEDGSILGVAGSCKLKYAIYPQVLGKYGVVTILTTEASGGSQIMFGEGHSLNVYNQNTKGALYTPNDQLSILSQIGSHNSSVVGEENPIVVGESVLSEMVFPLGLFVNKFVARHFSTSCNVLHAQEFFKLGTYAAAASVFMPYLMVGRDFFVPIFESFTKIKVEQALNIKGDKADVSGKVSVEIVNADKSGITSPTNSLYRPSAVSVEGYFKREGAMDIEGDDDWYTCPISPYNPVDFLSSTEFF